MIRSAMFSPDRTKRYELMRDRSDELALDSFQTVNFIMLNPSVAGETVDDPTIRKCLGFARRWGYSRVVVTNLIPNVATDPWNLPAWSGLDPANTRALHRWMTESQLVVVAWGSYHKTLARTIALEEHIYLVMHHRPRCDLYCIGQTKTGQPLHPSRCCYTGHPVLFALWSSETSPVIQFPDLQRA